MSFIRAITLGVALGIGVLAGCTKDDLSQPAPLGNFALGLNIVVTDKIQKVPISRDATGEEWQAAMTKAVADRFGPYQGDKLYDLGISVDAFALAPPGIPLVASPKSILVITANIWDDAAQLKLNPEGKQMTIFEGLSGETLVGSGLTQTREQQMAKLAYNAAKAVQNWLLQHPEWFKIPPEAPAAPATK